MAPVAVNAAVRVEKHWRKTQNGDILAAELAHGCVIS
jgi:hypothetical protein